MLESQLQRKIIKQYENMGYYVVKIIQCSKPGFPDLMLLKDGKIIFIEVKQKGKKLRPLQEYRKNEIIKQGFEYIVIDNVDNFI